jgi:hypothetical protein
MLWLSLFSAISIYFVFNASVISIGRAGGQTDPDKVEVYRESIHI